MFGVVQRGCCFGFPLEAAEGLLIISKVIGQELEGDAPTQYEADGRNRAPALASWRISLVAKGWQFL